MSNDPVRRQSMNCSQISCFLCNSTLFGPAAEVTGLVLRDDASGVSPSFDCR